MRFSSVSVVDKVKQSPGLVACAKRGVENAKVATILERRRIRIFAGGEFGVLKPGLYTRYVSFVDDGNGCTEIFMSL